MRNRFAGDALFRHLEIASQNREKDDDTGVITHRKGAPRLPSSFAFEKTGVVVPEFAQAVKDNPDYFDDFAGRLLNSVADAGGPIA
jgi:hypothetical protein